MTHPLLILLYGMQETWRSASKFAASGIPDLAGKVFFIADGDAGIGKETARVLLEHNAKVYIGCRYPEKARDAVEELKTRIGATDAQLVLVRLDLSDFSSIKAAVSEVTSKESRLDVLIINAGHFYLTQLLLPLLLSSAKTSESGKARVVNVSSIGHWGTTAGKDAPVRYETLVDCPERRNVSTESMYFQSKSGNVLFSHALARRYADQGIVSTSLHPVSIASDLLRHTGPIMSRIWRLTQSPVELGAITQLYAAIAPQADRLNGKYLGPWARVRPSDQRLDDVTTQEMLWDWLEEQVKLYAPVQLRITLPATRFDTV